MKKRTGEDVLSELFPGGRAAADGRSAAAPFSQEGDDLPCAVCSVSSPHAKQGGSWRRLPLIQ